MNWIKNWKSEGISSAGMPMTVNLRQKPESRGKGNGEHNPIHREVLKLKVNRNKSAVDRPSRRKFLGFSFYVMKGKARNFIHKKPIARFKAKVKEITSRSNGMSMEMRKERLNWLITGWVNYFHIADMEKVAKELDQWIRRRIRMCYWKQWKKISTRYENLIKLGV